jgi:mRNA interferase RelE/StbE
MNSKENWLVDLARKPKKEIKKFPKKDRERILDILYTFTNNPYSGDAFKMEGYENRWRRRVGSYRILYKIDANKKLVTVIEIKRRTSSTY